MQCVLILQKGNSAVIVTRSSAQFVVTNPYHKPVKGKIITKYVHVSCVLIKIIFCIGSNEAAPSRGAHNRETTNPNARKDNDVNQPDIQEHGRVKELAKVYSVSFIVMTSMHTCTHACRIIILNCMLSVILPRKLYYNISIRSSAISQWL